jgi:hypothetical protein
MIRAKSPARVEADPARDQPPHAPPTPTGALRSGWFSNWPHKPLKAERRDLGHERFQKRRGFVWQPKTLPEESLSHRAERLSTSTQADRGSLPQRKLLSPLEFCWGLDNFYGFLENDNVMRTKRASRWRSVLFQRST